MIKKILFFTREVVKRIFENDLYTQANAMTFRMILAIFPMIIVMIASISFFGVELESYVSPLLNNINDETKSIFVDMLEDVFVKKHVSIISVSAVVSIYSASSGIYAMIKAMNKTFDKVPEKGFFRTRIVSIFLVITFIVIIILSLGVLIFGDLIGRFLISLEIFKHTPYILSNYIYDIFFLFVGVSLCVSFLIVVNKIAVDKKIPTKNLLPGAFFTVGVWLIASKIFNFYVNNFYRYSLLYGSIGTFFVFSLWMNIFCYVILIGSQINAVLYDKNFMDWLNNL